MRSKKILYFFVPLTYSLIAQASVPQVLSGSARIERSAENHLQIHSVDKTILHWSDFSIGVEEVVQFIQPIRNLPY